MKYKIVLFQPFLRSHILNFGKHLKKCEFVLASKKEDTTKLYKKFKSYDYETNRKKISAFFWVRRILGIPNARIRIEKDGDLLFTYSCLLLTNRPYCVFIESGISIYAYDNVIAKNPIAAFITSLLIKRRNCKKLIFMSETAQKSFLSSAKYSSRIQKIIQEKSIQCYPLVKSEVQSPKKYSGEIRLLFTGTFYIKGGREIVNTFKKIREKYKNVTLTIISQVKAIKDTDIKHIKGIEGINLHDAVFNKQQMDDFYHSHNIFLSPTLRDSFGMILIEIMPFGMPVIGNDQYATREMIIDGYNGFLFPSHPLKDYDNKTYKIFGKYRNPKDFYADLFKYQKEGKMKPVEDFLYNSIEKFLINPELLEKFSRNSIELYNKKFHYDLISDRIESIFLDAIKK